MKLYTTLFGLILLVLFQINTFSQIPNAGFENWTDGNPDGWFTDNIPGFATPVVQSNENHSGSFAARLEVISFGGSGFPGYIWSGENFGQGFPISQAYGSLTGYYQFNRVGDDELYVIVYLRKSDQYVGVGSEIIGVGTTGGYNQFVVSIEPLPGPTPDSAFIWIGISDSSDGEVNVGTFVLIDDLEFGGSVDVQLENPIATSFSLQQNYPNPFNPSTKINFSITEQSYVELIVYDLLGSEIEKLVSDNYPAGEYSIDFNAENLPNGIYIAKMNAGKYSKAIKMTLLK